MRGRAGSAVVCAIGRRWEIRTKILSFGFGDMEAIGEPSKSHLVNGGYWGQKIGWRGPSNAREKTWSRILLEKFGCGRREERLVKGESEDQGEVFFRTRDTLPCLNGLWVPWDRDLKI